MLNGPSGKIPSIPKYSNKLPTDDCVYAKPYFNNNTKQIQYANILKKFLTNHPIISCSFRHWRFFSYFQIVIK